MGQTLQYRFPIFCETAWLTVFTLQSIQYHQCSAWLNPKEKDIIHFYDIWVFLYNRSIIKLLRFRFLQQLGRITDDSKLYSCLLQQALYLHHYFQEVSIVQDLRLSYWLTFGEISIICNTYLYQIFLFNIKWCFCRKLLTMSCQTI